MIIKQKCVRCIKKASLEFIYVYIFTIVVGYLEFNPRNETFMEYVRGSFTLSIILFYPVCLLGAVWEDYKKTNLKLSTFIKEHRVLYGWITSFIAVGCLVLGKLYGYPFFLWLRSHGLA